MTIALATKNPTVSQTEPAGKTEQSLLQKALAFVPGFNRSREVKQALVSGINTIHSASIDILKGSAINGESLAHASHDFTSRRNVELRPGLEANGNKCVAILNALSNHSAIDLSSLNIKEVERFFRRLERRSGFGDKEGTTLNELKTAVVAGLTAVEQYNSRIKSGSSIRSESIHLDRTTPAIA